MFIDEMVIHAEAGNGGNGVVRWHRERSRPLGGPAGGNGGRGGSVYLRAVRDNNILSKYTGATTFRAEHGGHGMGHSRYGKDGSDLYIDVPVGSVITQLSTGRKTELFTPGEEICILKGGTGGLGNEFFKSSTNRSPEEHTAGKKGEIDDFKIEVELVVDVGLVGAPNAGKSTLLNTLTRAQSKVAEYEFTTLEPHLGDLFGYTIADIPGLIEGAGEGKGLGHKFLRHVKRTQMLLHCVSCESEDVRATYRMVRKEIESFDPTMSEKVEWILLTKTDTVSTDTLRDHVALLKKEGKPVYTVSALDDTLIKNLKDALVKTLREGDTSATI